MLRGPLAKWLMDPAYEQKYYRIEQRHAWSVGRRDLVLAMLRAAGARPGQSVLDVGCGGGLLVRALHDAGYEPVVGLDMSPAAVASAAEQGIGGVRLGDGCAIDAPDASFDYVVASDVLEHILDEGRALHEWWRVVKPGGLVLVYVPAFSFLWSAHDVVNHHFRRYSRSQLQSVLLGSGFTIDRIGYWNSALFAPTLLVRMVARMQIRGKAMESEDDFIDLNPLTNGAVTQVLLAENRLIEAGFDPKVGVSVYAVARRPLDAPSSE